MSNILLEALRKLRESDNTNPPINLDYKKKDNVFLDKMWELVSPEYKIHWVKNPKHINHPNGCGFYILLDEAEYNDLAAEYTDENQLDDYIMDTLIFQNGYKSFVAELNPTGEVHLIFTPLDAFGTLGVNNTTYSSVEEFVNKFLLA